MQLIVLIALCSAVLKLRQILSFRTLFGSGRINWKCDSMPRKKSATHGILSWSLNLPLNFKVETPAETFSGIHGEKPADIKQFAAVVARGHNTSLFHWIPTFWPRLDDKQTRSASVGPFLCRHPAQVCSGLCLQLDLFWRSYCWSWDVFTVFKNSLRASLLLYYKQQFSPGSFLTSDVCTVAGSSGFALFLKCCSSENLSWMFVLQPGCLNLDISTWFP